MVRQAPRHAIEIRLVDLGPAEGVGLEVLALERGVLRVPIGDAVLLVAGGGQNSYSGAGEGTCEFRIDGVLSDSPSVRPGEPVSDNTTQFAQNGFSMTTVTTPLAAGSHSFALACNERIGEVEMIDTTISAVLAE